MVLQSITRRRDGSLSLDQEVGRQSRHDGYLGIPVAKRLLYFELFISCCFFESFGISRNSLQKYILDLKGAELSLFFLPLESVSMETDNLAPLVTVFNCIGLS